MRLNANGSLMLLPSASTLSAVLLFIIVLILIFIFKEEKQKNTNKLFTEVLPSPPSEIFTWCM